MIDRTQHGDVTALRMSWPRSRLVGYAVHLFFVRGVLVDTGFPGVARQFRALLDELRPDGAFVTHHHEDHAGNVRALVRAGIPVAMDAVTRARLRAPGRIGLYRHLVWKAMPPLEQHCAPFSHDTLSLVSTPGHCDNHQSVWDAETGTLFAGDLFLGVKVRAAHVYENPRLHVDTLRRMAARNPARVFCAHRGALAHPVALLTAKADWMSDVIHRAERMMDDGAPDDFIRQALLGPLGSTHYISAGDYSPRNLVRAIRATRSASGAGQ